MTFGHPQTSFFETIDEQSAIVLAHKATGTDDKELFLIPGATHIQTYWVPEYVDMAADKLADSSITDFKSDEKTPSSVHLRSDSGYSVEKWLRGIHVIR